MLGGEAIWYFPFVNPDNDFFEILLVRGRSEDVKTVIIGGKLAMKGGGVSGVGACALKVGLQALCLKRQVKMAQDRSLVDEMEGKLIKYLARWDEEGRTTSQRWYRYNLI